MNTLFEIPKPKFTPDQKLLALSWKEPFASLMLHGKIETRTWPTQYRGWVLICASKQPYNWEQIKRITDINESLLDSIFETLKIEYTWEGIKKGLNSLPNGKAIGIGRLVDCRQMRQADEGKSFVKYYPDLFCHVYDDVTPIEQFDWKGSQGWRELNTDQKNQIIIRS